MADIKPVEVRYLDHMGSDLSIVNAARTSFGKETNVWLPKDEKLINFLARGYMTEEWESLIDFVYQGVGQNCGDIRAPIWKRQEAEQFIKDVRSKATHFMPFCHAFLSFKIKAPIFVTRQLAKHQIGLAWSEESRRYLDDGIEFFMPDGWRSRPKGSIKQGSGDTFVTDLKWIDSEGHPMSRDIDKVVLHHLDEAIMIYNLMIDNGVAPEQARMILPLNMMTTWTWSGSLLAFARVANLRLDSHAQKETRDVVAKMHEIVAPLFPASWKALVNA